MGSSHEGTMHTMRGQADLSDLGARSERREPAQPQAAQPRQSRTVSWTVRPLARREVSEGGGTTQPQPAQRPETPQVELEGPALLKVFRESRKLSQSRLARMAFFDHSYISRVERGERTPSRDGVIQMSRAMQLSDDERDLLLAAFGFMPMRVTSLLHEERELARLFTLLSGERLGHQAKALARMQLELIADQLEMLA